MAPAAPGPRCPDSESGLESGVRVDIEVRSLVKRYGTTTAVDGLDLHARAGAVTGFLGPNGAGKTTTLRVLLGLVRPTAGDATIGGQPYHALDHPARHVGVVLEGSSFHPGRKAKDHLRILCTAAALPGDRIAGVLEQVGLAEVADRRVGQFSLGMRQRLQLAGALLGDPDVLVLDEPANGLDPEGIAWLRSLLQGFARAGRTVLISSHVLSEMQQLADEVVIVDRGRLVAAGELSALLAGSSQGLRVRTSDAPRLVPVLQARGAQVSTDGETLLVTGVDATIVGDVAAQEGVSVYEMTPVAATLEDVFFRATRPNGQRGEAR